MQISLDLSEPQVEALRARAKSLGISLEQLISIALTHIAADPAVQFQAHADRVLKKNAELYRRLA